MMQQFKRFLYIFCVACRPNQSRTIRLAFPLVWVSLSAIALSQLIGIEQSSVRLEPSQRQVEAGDQLYIDVIAESITPVNAIDLQISVPTEVFKINGIDAGESVISLWTEDPYHEDGVVFLSGGTFRNGFLGKHFIARINLTARESGTASVMIQNPRFLAGDGVGTEVDLEVDNTELLVIGEGGVLIGEVMISIVTDIDGDGRVDLEDLSRFMTAWSEGNVIYDFNGDNRMTFIDFSILLSDSFFK